MFTCGQSGYLKTNRRPEPGISRTLISTFLEHPRVVGFSFKASQPEREPLMQPRRNDSPLPDPFDPWRRGRCPRCERAAARPLQRASVADALWCECRTCGHMWLAAHADQTPHTQLYGRS